VRATGGEARDFLQRYPAVLVEVGHPQHSCAAAHALDLAHAAMLAGTSCARRPFDHDPAHGAPLMATPEFVAADHSIAVGIEAVEHR
jgi:hypothetical protein